MHRERCKCLQDELGLLQSSEEGAPFGAQPESAPFPAEDSQQPELAETVADAKPSDNDGLKPNGRT
jgi:hypothetical protein